MVELFPTKFYLGQNHPNPFKKTTLIKYCVPEVAKIKLEIVDNERRMIKILVDEVKEPGTYQVEFRGDGLDAGEYICKLESDYYRETKKMVLIK